VTAPASKPQGDPVASFRRRCAVAAADWLAGGLDLHDAVDGLAAWAATHGIDTDVAQRGMSSAFAPYRRPGDGGQAPCPAS
jgi:hypothetical protein